MNLLDQLTIEPSRSPRDPVECNRKDPNDPRHQWRFVRSASSSGNTASEFKCDNCGKEVVE